MLDFSGVISLVLRQKFSLSARYDLAFLVPRISVAVAVAVAWSEWGFLGKEFKLIFGGG